MGCVLVYKFHIQDIETHKILINYLNNYRENITLAGMTISISNLNCKNAFHYLQRYRYYRRISYTVSVGRKRFNLTTFIRIH